MDRVKVIWVSYVPQARPSVPPQGPKTGILGFSQKGTGAKSVDMASREPRAVNLFLRGTKNSRLKIKKNGHDALIWYLLNAGWITSDETRLIWLLSVYIVSYIPFPNSLHK